MILSNMHYKRQHHHQKWWGAANHRLLRIKHDAVISTFQSVMTNDQCKLARYRHFLNLNHHIISFTSHYSWALHHHVISHAIPSFGHCDLVFITFSCLESAVSGFDITERHSFDTTRQSIVRLWQYMVSRHTSHGLSILQCSLESHGSCLSL